MYNKEYHAAYWVKNRDKLIAQRVAFKQEVMIEYGGECICCGERELAFLTIDHINNDGAEHRRSVLGRNTAGMGFYLWLRREGFPKDGLQVLCWNCQWGRRILGECPHKQ